MLELLLHDLIDRAVHRKLGRVDGYLTFLRIVRAVELVDALDIVRVQKLVGDLAGLLRFDVLRIRLPGSSVADLRVSQEETRPFVMVLPKDVGANIDRVHIRHARRLVDVLAHRAKYRKQYPREDRDNPDNDEHLNDGEAMQSTAHICSPFCSTRSISGGPMTGPARYSGAPNPRFDHRDAKSMANCAADCNYHHDHEAK